MAEVAPSPTARQARSRWEINARALSNFLKRTPVACGPRHFTFFSLSLRFLSFFCLGLNIFLVVLHFFCVCVSSVFFVHVFCSVFESFRDKKWALSVVLWHEARAIFFLFFISFLLLSSFIFAISIFFVSSLLFVFEGVGTKSWAYAQDLFFLFVSFCFVWLGCAITRLNKYIIKNSNK